MDCGKSTLALQLDYNHSRQGRSGMLLTKLDRSGPAQISSRIGISRRAVEVADDQDLRELVRDNWSRGRRVDYLIVDEAQFFTAAQIEQLTMLADDAQVDVYAFGIATDFRGRFFPGSARLFELADEVSPLQVEVLCWCGRIGRFNGRVIGGRSPGRAPPLSSPTPRPPRRPPARSATRCCAGSTTVPAPSDRSRASPMIRPTLVNRLVHGMLMLRALARSPNSFTFRVTDTQLVRLKNAMHHSNGDRGE